MTRPLPVPFATAIAAALLLSACGSPGPAARADSAAKPMMHISSARSPAAIVNCLTSRLARAQSANTGSTTEITVGANSNPAYWVTLTPAGSGYGAVVKVLHPANAPEDPPEPEMRFNIARCTT
ncbi:sugar ABC transporter ATPase [Paraburkholderia bonniea]|uniref:sugar ABC transporter ATPase n=1 Tax=Paraburkholderia bonniea TaxID=2152891 RepID=UPI0012928826|nr:sugar ABC transporter ATPase [Paraburkholderia bonniea]WJF89255.1 sugar ABC transporter ATPase [Paraburkholderia bonniea]WJF92571.1 sugar ABC transporter ATPase [Paraburkholderia bonniea]